MAETMSRARCLSCGRGLSYEAWSAGETTCDSCARQQAMSGPAATYVRGPAPSRAPSAPATARAGEPQAGSYERILDDMPDELVEELVAALEAEVAKLEREKAAPKTPVREVLEEIGLNGTPREWQWAAWGFAAGFGANVVLAKYAQMSSGGGMGEFAMPLLLGGVAAGVTCGAIGWGFSKLR